jgi:hypothetical protein
MKQRRSFARSCAGVSLAEAALAIVVVAVAIGAGLRAATQAAATRTAITEQTSARTLGQSLLDEVAAVQYEEPLVATIELGVEAGETVATARTTADDIDDYNSLTESVALDRDGFALQTGGRVWRRRVSVTWVSAADLTTVSDMETGVKLITVEVFNDRRVVCTLEVLRTRGWDVAARGAEP